MSSLPSALSSSRIPNTLPMPFLGPRIKLLGKDSTLSRTVRTIRPSSFTPRNHPFTLQERGRKEGRDVERGVKAPPPPLFFKHGRLGLGEYQAKRPYLFEFVVQHVWERRTMQIHRCGCRRSLTKEWKGIIWLFVNFFRLFPRFRWASPV